jgi:hypothetical protein
MISETEEVCDPIFGWGPYHHHFPYLLLWDSEQDGTGAGHQGGAPAGEAGDARDAGDLEGFGQGHGGQDRDLASSQHRFARTRGTRDADGYPS